MNRVTSMALSGKPFWGIPQTPASRISAPASHTVEMQWLPWHASPNLVVSTAPIDSKQRKLGVSIQESPTSRTRGFLEVYVRGQDALTLSVGVEILGRRAYKESVWIAIPRNVVYMLKHGCMHAGGLCASHNKCTLRGGIKIDGYTEPYTTGRWKVNLPEVNQHRCSIDGRT